MQISVSVLEILVALKKDDVVATLHRINEYFEAQYTQRFCYKPDSEILTNPDAFRNALLFDRDAISELFNKKFRVDASRLRWVMWNPFGGRQRPFPRYLAIEVEFLGPNADGHYGEKKYFAVTENKFAIAEAEGWR